MCIAVTHMFYKLSDSGRKTNFTVSCAIKNECFNMNLKFTVSR